MNIKSTVVVCIVFIITLFCSCDTFTMFKHRTNIKQDHHLAELAEMIAQQFIEQPVPSSKKRDNYNFYKYQKKYPVHPLDKPGTSKYTKNRKKGRSHQ